MGVLLMGLVALTIPWVLFFRHATPPAGRWRHGCNDNKQE